MKRAIRGEASIASRHVSAGWAAIAVAAAVLAWLAAGAGASASGASVWLIALDVGVGVGFVGASAVAPGSARMRALQATVGLSWLAGSVFPIARVSHQAALAIALLTYPTGRPRAVDWVGVALAVPVALSLVPQGLVALLFAAIATWVIVRPRSGHAGPAYPAAAAAGVALVLGAAWATRGFAADIYDPAVVLVGYELVLLMVAIGFPVAMRSIDARTGRVSEVVLTDEALTGLEGLGAVLAEALGDPDIRVYGWDGAQRAYVDARGRAAEHHQHLRWLSVADGPVPLGMIAHRSAALEDQGTAETVTEAMRLALLNLRWQRALQDQLDELGAARARLIGAADRERAAVATRLREDVISRIREAADALREAGASAVNGSGDALEVALAELEAAGDEVMQLVAGVPATELGGGGLGRALRDLAERSPIHVEVVSDPEAAADPATETALYYACAEALANAVKHAAASRVRIEVRQTANTLEVTVADDGVGGADPGGSGLKGVADRIAAHGGRLRVESPPGAGTAVIASLPR